MSLLSTRWRSLRRRASDRGATLVEYALLVALFGLVLVASVDALQGSETEYLESSSDRIGMPDLDASPPGATTTTGPGEGPQPTEPPPDSVLVQIEAPTVSADEQGNNWRARIDFLASGSGLAKEGVVISGFWSPSGGGGQTTTSCTTDSAGTCQMVRWNMSKDTYDQATFTITSVSGPGYSPAPGMIGTEIVVFAPGAEPPDPDPGDGEAPEGDD